jgi:para-aminobenzoate synthetase/4-amino-4-deoxychorismate lyase
MLNEVIVARRSNDDWLRFRDPVAVVAAYSSAQVYPAMVEVERRVNLQGLYAAGFVSFEAASGFDEALVTRERGLLPLVCFGLYPQPEVLSAVSDENPASSACWQNATGQDGYYQALTRIKRQIGAGNVYQVNYTLRLGAPAVPCRALFAEFGAGASYGAFVDADAFAIMSASPELFFDLRGHRLTSRPMKGTARRGRTLEQDRTQRDWLAASEKNRAENLMITDMVRNDVGRIARVGSVRVKDLFRVEKYPTVWQMTSTVTADTDASVAEIFQAMFPGASITGAPKRASMEQIAKLEGTPREIYTGCIGYIAPERHAQFSIAIRTAWTDKSAGTMSYGVGGGIVWDSDPAEELEEIATKTRVLKSTRREREFELLETMRWEPQDGLVNLSWHLRRLSDSAEYFDFTFSKEAFQSAVEGALKDLESVCHRVRVCVNRAGNVTVQCEPLTLGGAEQALVLAHEPVDPDNPFLYHKTTNRKVYEDAARFAGTGEEVLLFNTGGFVTETNIANVVYRLADGWYTPPVSEGLLPGTMRARLLEEKKVSERRLAVGELGEIKEICLVSSLRGWRKARLVRKQPGVS